MHQSVLHAGALTRDLDAGELAAVNGGSSPIGYAVGYLVGYAVGCLYDAIDELL